MTQNLNAPKLTPPVLTADDVRSTTNDPLKILKPPSPQWAIWIAEDVAMYTRYERPNTVRHFFLWLFFGWRYTKVKQNDEV